MLSSFQKADILARAGVNVPMASPAVNHDDGPAPSDRWLQEIDNLFAGYVARRAARSLREAEEARTLAKLRQANTRLTHPSDPDGPDED
ncbi:MAG: hypothetical protein DI563_02160 [Variovorax paradoxus]|uniref:Uncharacterized protein n=1 Tax=Variovorax paradoxus TaxID=34073 RepID=A0A2W5SE38_VARPD|nr:MAG: hypothetical protein DI563_02160 [Variovorax paradoxus]|tara:strand:+ start:391 stop:657 length:267 start_codon:yes stop_codon:yes gene_type:complete